MSTATKTNPRTEALINALEDLKTRGQVSDFKTDVAGTKRSWTITVNSEVAVALGDFKTDGLNTTEAEAFVAGVKVGAKRRGGGGRTQKDNPFRNAIRDKGLVEVSTKGKDASEQKRLRTAIFNAAYSLGLKGKFKVRTEENKLVGEVTDKRALSGKRAAASKDKATQIKAKSGSKATLKAAS